LASKKFQERLSGASRMQENLLAARAPPRTTLGEFSAIPQPPSWLGGGWLPLSKPPPRSLSPDPKLEAWLLPT